MIDSSTIKDMIRRVFSPSLRGRGLGGEAVFLLIFLFSCSRTEAPPEGGDYCPVSFTLSGITPVESEAEQLADGATVRVVVYKRSGSSASLTADNYLTECTYRVTGSGGTLTPCAVNSDGVADVGAAAPKEPALLEGTYDFYAITPALTVNHTGDQPTVSVGQGVDFAVSQSSAAVAPGAAAVTLNTLERLCAQLFFFTDRTDTSIRSISIEKLTLTAMATTPKTVTGTGTLAADVGAVQVDIPGSAFTGSGYAYTVQTAVLPKGSAAFTLKATVKFNGSATVATFEEPVNATALEAGRGYAFILKFNGYGMEVKQENAWQEIVKEDDDFGSYVDLNASGKSANCYIVTGNEAGIGTNEYGFTYTVRGNNATSVSGINYNTLPDLSTATEARVLWQTGGVTSVIRTVTLDKDNGKVIFTTGSATEGNAVIGIFASSDDNAPCLWSWHIWRLPSKPADIDCVKTPSPASASASFKMMDRNLGAYNNTPGNVGSIGLLYQWGRKDPFPGAGAWSNTEPSNIYGAYINASDATGTWSGAYSVQAVETSATYGTEAWAVKHPTVFIKGTNSPYDWYNGSTRNDCLWGTPWQASGSVSSYNGRQGKKSIYDPCPIGYRVPPQDTWSKAGNGGFANNGMTLNGISSAFWFPAAGLRVNNSGSFGNVTSNGFYWSSSPGSSGSNGGGSLSFSSGGNIFPQNSYLRSYGLSVRCVSESVSEL